MEMKIRQLSRSARALPLTAAFIAVFCVTLLSSHPALAQFTQQGPKLAGTGAVWTTSQGFSVSLSAYRHYFIPDYRFGGLGFRLSRSL
jgi:hypothetical protein